MKPTRWTAAIAIVATTSFITPLLAPTIAFAKPTTKPEKKKGLRDSLSGEAREAFDRAVDLFSKAKNPSGALAEFDRALSLSKDARLLYNMAVCERDLKRYARAITLLNRELTEGADSLSEADQANAKSLIDGLSAFTAPLVITSNEAGATVLVDDLDVGTTPLSQAITVDVGERKIVVKKSGFVDFTKTLTVAARAQSALEAKLEPTVKKGKLAIRANGSPEPATIRVDGVDIGVSPWEGELTAGTHTIEIRSPNYVTITRNETIAYNDSRSIELALRLDQGLAHISTNSEKNQIVVDNKPVGKGTWEGPLPAGSHQVTVSRDGYETTTQPFIIQTDQTQNIQIALKSKGGVAWYWWVIGGAVVVGGGIGVYAATRPKTLDPQPGTLNPGVAPVGFHF